MKRSQAMGEASAGRIGKTRSMARSLIASRHHVSDLRGETQRPTTQVGALARIADVTPAAVLRLEELA